MHISLVSFVIATCLGVEAPPVNTIFQELVERGAAMSTGASVKLPPPILADGLDAAAQRKALTRLADSRMSLDDLIGESYHMPAMVKVRTIRKASRPEGPVVRSVDLWFVVHGDWNILTSKDFLASMAKTSDAGDRRTASKSGVLTKEELARRKLSITEREGVEEQFAHTMFSLFERVELSMTRRTMLCRGKDVVLAAGVIDPRFNKDPDYPNRWRPLLRDARAEIYPGPAHPFTHAGGYAKITRLCEPAGSVFVECHLVYEEDYGWFDGANLVKQKTLPMVQEKVRQFRRKLAAACEEKAAKEKAKQ